MSDNAIGSIPARRGRPPKARSEPILEREFKREPTTTSRFKMRAAPNWESVDPNADSSPDRLRINPDLIPEGMSAMWVTDSVLGQGVPQHRSEFERKGWTPVHQDDFDSQFNGMFMPKNAPGEINVEGLVLMMRPVEMTMKAERAAKLKAYNQVALKEHALRSGDIPGVAEARHPSATAL